MLICQFIGQNDLDVKQAYHDHELMSAHVFCRPYCGAAGRNGSIRRKDVGHFEPEQVIIFADSSVGFQSKSCCEVSGTVKPAVSPSIPQVP